MDGDAEQTAAMLTAVGFTYDQASGSWVHENGRAITKETVAAHESDWVAHWITGS